MSYTIPVEVLLSNLEIGDSYTVTFSVGSSGPSSVLPQSLTFSAYKKSQSVSVIVTKPEDQIAIVNAVSKNNRTNIVDTTSVFVKCEHESICKLSTPTPTRTGMRPTPTASDASSSIPTRTPTPTPTKFPLCRKTAAISNGKDQDQLSGIDQGRFTIDISDYAVPGTIFVNSILKFNSINFGRVFVDIVWPTKPDSLPVDQFLEQSIDLPANITEQSPIYELYSYTDGVPQRIKGQINQLSVNKTGDIITYTIDGTVISDDTGSGIELQNSTLVVEVDTSNAKNISSKNEYVVFVRDVDDNMDDGFFIKNITFSVMGIDGVLFCFATPTPTTTPTTTPTPTPTSVSIDAANNFYYRASVGIPFDINDPSGFALIEFYLQNHIEASKFKVFDLQFDAIFLGMYWRYRPSDLPTSSIILNNITFPDLDDQDPVINFISGSTQVIKSNIVFFDVSSDGSNITYSISSIVTNSIDSSLIGKNIGTTIKMDISQDSITRIGDGSPIVYHYIDNKNFDETQNNLVKSITINDQPLPIYGDFPQPVDDEFKLSIPEGIGCSSEQPYKLKWTPPFLPNISAYYIDTIYENNTVYSSKQYPSVYDICFNPKERYNIDRDYSLVNSAIPDLPPLSVGTIVRYKARFKFSDTGEYDTGSFSSKESNIVALICSSTDGNAGYWNIFTGPMPVPTLTPTPTPTKIQLTTTPTPSVTQIPIVNTIDISSLNTLQFEYQNCADIGLGDSGDCAMGEVMFYLDEFWDSMDPETFGWKFNDIGIQKISSSKIRFYFPAASFADYLGPNTLPNWFDPSTDQPYYTDYYYYQYVINETQIITTIPKKYNLNTGVPPHLIGQFNLGQSPYIIGEIDNLPVGSRIDFNIGTISYPGLTQNVAKRFGVPQIGKKLLDFKGSGSPITFTFQL